MAGATRPRPHGAWLLALTGASALAGCGLDPAVLQGRRCDADGACAAGSSCDLPSGRCLPDAGLACAPEGASYPCGQAIGECRSGVVACAGGVWTACSADSPGVERCNGRDDDCDGTTDEDWPSVGQACSATYLSCVIDGVMLCTASGQELICSAALDPGEETCDGQDNDCDGLTDEIDLDNDQAYACPFWGPAMDCDDNATFVHPGQVEACNGRDDDCDGATDEDWPDLGLACSVGLGPCRRSGQQVCGSGGGSGYACDVQPGTSSEERCNALDDDCDGDTDEDWPLLGEACSAGLGICRNSGQWLCQPDGQGARCSAIPYLPRLEVCNALDDDCDGVTDEVDEDGDGHTPCPLAAAGQPLDCDDARSDVYPGAAEVCDERDNDCNSEVDEGWLGTLERCLSCADLCLPLAGGSGAHARTYCLPTGCAFSCDFPWFDVDGVAATGCELADDTPPAASEGQLNNDWTRPRDLGEISECDDDKELKFCSGRLPRDGRVHDPPLSGPQAVDFVRLRYKNGVACAKEGNVQVTVPASQQDAVIEACLSGAVDNTSTAPGGWRCKTVVASDGGDLRWDDELPDAGYYYLRVRALEDDGAGHAYQPFAGVYHARMHEAGSANWSYTCP